MADQTYRQDHRPPTPNINDIVERLNPIDIDSMLREYQNRMNAHGLALSDQDYAEAGALSDPEAVESDESDSSNRARHASSDSEREDEGERGRRSHRSPGPPPQYRQIAPQPSDMPGSASTPDLHRVVPIPSNVPGFPPGSFEIAEVISPSGRRRHPSIIKKIGIPRDLSQREPVPRPYLVLAPRPQHSLPESPAGSADLERAIAEYDFFQTELDNAKIDLGRREDLKDRTTHEPIEIADPGFDQDEALLEPLLEHEEEFRRGLKKRIDAALREKRIGQRRADELQSRLIMAWFGHIEREGMLEDYDAVDIRDERILRLAE